MLCRQETKLKPLRKRPTSSSFIPVHMHVMLWNQMPVGPKSCQRMVWIGVWRMKNCLPLRTNTSEYKLNFNYILSYLTPLSTALKIHVVVLKFVCKIASWAWRKSQSWATSFDGCHSPTLGSCATPWSACTRFAFWPFNPRIFRFPSTKNHSGLNRQFKGCFTQSLWLTAKRTPHFSIISAYFALNCSAHALQSSHKCFFLHLNSTPASCLRRRPASSTNLRPNKMASLPNTAMSANSPAGVPKLGCHP